MGKIQGWQLQQKQSLPLEAKIILSKERIREYYEYFDGEVYIAFSGGKDSTVLLDLIRSLYPDVSAMFVDTGLEFPEIRNFIKTIDNVDWIKPERTYKDVVMNEGYPIISKVVAMAFDRYFRTKDPIQKQLRLYGGVNPTTNRVQKMGVIPKKYHYLLKAPFKISDCCCYWLKKKPVRKYDSKTGKKSYIGMMASDSMNRRMMYLREGCNSFEKNIRSNPLGFWLEKDIWEYIKHKKISYSCIYDMGYDRQGCMFCMFGIMQEPEPNRFLRMAKTHPSQHNYCINKLNLGVVLDWLKIDYGELNESI